MEQQQSQEERLKNLTFNLNGKDYKYSECTDEQKQMVHQLNDIENQLAELDFKFNQVNAAKNQFTDMLTKSYEKKDSKSEESASEAPEVPSAEK